jgi:rod shape-determining protein MreC
LKITGKKKSRFLPGMLLVAALCCVLTNASYNSGVSSFAASAVGVVVTPIKELAANMRQYIAEATGYFGDIKELKAENEALKSELGRLTRENSELTPLKAENEMLYRFLGLKTERTDLELVNAEIISRSASNYTSDFTVDKGSVHGIEKNMAVITEDGSLLGIIIEVGATYSRGKVLTSYDFNVGVKNERTGEPGVLSGTFELNRDGLCAVNDLYDNTEYAVGDIIRTSSLGEIYPPGIYVGRVKEIIPDSLGYTVSAVIEVSASVNDTDKVMIITDFDRNYVELEGEAVTEIPGVTEEKPSEDTGLLPAVPSEIPSVTVPDQTETNTEEALSDTSVLPVEIN